MRIIVWTVFGVALVLINVISEVGEYYTGIHIHMMLRISFILGVTMGMSILAGTMLLVYQLGEEKPLSGYVKDTLSNERFRA